MFARTTELMLLLAVAAASGCGGRQTPLKAVFVEDDDANMKAAIDKARSTVNQFIAALQKPKKTQENFSIKMLFKDGEEGEHMWLLPVTYDGKQFTGVVNNMPEKIKTAKLKQRVTIDPDKISDWMYIENGKLVGGFTIRALHERLSPEERKEMEKTLPFKFE
jgi:uncharacterized protein YegJ (DUF2314 family)